MLNRLRSLFAKKPISARVRKTKLAVERLELRQLMASDVPGSMSMAMDLGPIGSQDILVKESIGVPQDVDMYKIRIIGGQEVGFDIDTDSNGPPGLGSYLRIFDAMGKELAANNDRLAPGDPPPGANAGSQGFDSYIPYRFGSSGTYYVGVSNWLNRSYSPGSGVGNVMQGQWKIGDYRLVVSWKNKLDSIIHPVSASFKADGAVEVGYSVTSALPANTQIPISVYWAKGGTGLDALPVGRPVALYTYNHPSSSGQGSYRFTIPASKMTTAPSQATHFVIVANPQNNLGSLVSTPAIFSLAAKNGKLTAAQLRIAMPGLSSADASRLVGPLNQSMFNYGISTLEQQSMFLSQIGHESQNLTLWSEKYNGSSADAYFINKYWVDPSRWDGLGASTPTVNGLTLRVPAGINSPATKVFKLYFAKSVTLNSAAQFQTTLTFTKSNGQYVAQFAGAIPPALTTHLLVVDPANSNKVVSAIRNKEGNWRPMDASNFRGRGPIQLTGRYNYQLFANFSKTPQLMTNPSLLSNSAQPELGLNSAGWYWQIQYSRKLNELTNSQAGASSEEFNRQITQRINPGLNGLADRLARYRRIRAGLMT